MAPQISEFTRRNIIDDLRALPLLWHGRLGEVEFLSRLYDLDTLPSTDGRFRTMAADISQHRFANDDWPVDWVFDDARLALTVCDDVPFLRFLCEMIHPVVRPSPDETRTLLAVFNEHLAMDGYEIYESKRISNRPVFAARLITSPVVLASEHTITAEFVREQLRKCDEKLSAGDLDGAIASSRSLVEGVMGEIHLRCTGKTLPSSGDLLTDYKRVKDLLNLSEDQQIHEGLKGLIRSFNGVIQNIDYLSNKIGDRHRPVLRPEKHHAKLVVDSAKTLADFLYSTLESQTNRASAFESVLLTALNNDVRFLERDELLKDTDVARVLASSDVYLRRLVKDALLKNYSIDSYRRSDIFFAAMRVLLEELDVNDVVAMHIEAQRNNQAIGWVGFKSDLEKIRPGLLGRAMETVYGESGQKPGDSVTRS